MSFAARLRILFLILLLCGELAPSPALAGSLSTAPTDYGSVPMYRGGPARTGENPGLGPNGTPELRWKAWLGVIVSSSPAVDNGLVYVGSASPLDPAGGALHAIDAATGQERWRLSTVDGDGFFSSPAVAEGRVYIGSYYGFVIAADAATGEERWRFQADDEVHSSPAVVDGVVYIGDLGGTLYAVDAATGELRWRLAFDRYYERYVNSSPAVVDGAVYVVAGPRRAGKTSYLYAVDAATGKERWHFAAEEGGILRGTPVVAGGIVYVADYAGFLYAVGADDGSESWRFDVKAVVPFTSPAVSDGIAYLGTSNGELYAVDTATGRERWSSRLSRTAAISSSPAIAGGTIYLGDAGGILYAVDAATGDERWHLGVDSFLSSPAVVGGLVYVGTDAGRLVALGDPQNRPIADTRGSAGSPGSLQ
jgi:outer membrane protein assembly factor BamB